MPKDSRDIQLRDQRKARHFWADNEIYDDHAAKIGAYAFAVYMALCRLARNETARCYTTCRQLGDKLDLSPQTISRALHALEKHGLIAADSVSESKKEASCYAILAVQKSAPTVPIGNSSHEATVPIGISTVPIGNTNTKTKQETNTSLAAQVEPFTLTPQVNGNGTHKADPRFKIFMAYLKQYWDEANEHKIEFPNPGQAGGAQLNALLKKSPDLTAEQFLDIVNNRLESAGVNHAEEVHRWLPKCLNYLHGPLDAYGKPRSS